MEGSYAEHENVCSYLPTCCSPAKQRCGFQISCWAQIFTKTLLEKPLQEMLQSSTYQILGALQATQNLSLNLSLPLRNEAQLDKFLLEVSDPNSSNYRHY